MKDSNLDLFLPSKPSNQRQKRVAEEIRKIISEAILLEDFPTEFKELTNNQKGLIASVTHVDIGSDLNLAKVFISPYKENLKILELFKKNEWHFRKLLSKKLKLRKVPKVLFAVDETIEKMEKIGKILQSCQ
jgi:ribosome-binding factor A